MALQPFRHSDQKNADAPKETNLSAPKARDDRSRAFDERRLVVTLEVGPGGERSSVRHPVDEELPVEVIELVLERAGDEPLRFEIDVGAGAVPRAYPDVHPPGHFSAEVRHGEAALVVLE